MKKGLRPTLRPHFTILMNEHRPDEKGIATCGFPNFFYMDTSNEHRPDEKGIATFAVFSNTGSSKGTNTDLMKKGLRHRYVYVCAAAAERTQT